MNNISELLQIEPISTLEHMLDQIEHNLKVTYPDANTLYRYILSPDPGLNAWGIVSPVNPKDENHRKAVKIHSIAEAKIHFISQYKTELTSDSNEKTWKLLKPLFQIEAQQQSICNWTSFQNILSKENPTAKDLKKRQKYTEDLTRTIERLFLQANKNHQTISEADLTELAKAKMKSQFINRSRSSITSRFAKKLDKKIRLKDGMNNIYRGVLERLQREKVKVSSLVKPGISRTDCRFFGLHLTEVVTNKGADYLTPILVEEHLKGLSRKNRRKPVGTVAMCYRIDPVTQELAVDAATLEQPGTYVQGYGGAIGSAAQTSVSNYEKAGVLDGPNSTDKPVIDLLLSTAFSNFKRARQKVVGIVHPIRSGGNPARIATHIVGGLIDVDAALKSPSLTVLQKTTLSNRKFYRLSELQGLLDRLESKKQRPVGIALQRELMGLAWMLQSSQYKKRSGDLVVST